MVVFWPGQSLMLVVSALLLAYLPARVEETLPPALLKARAAVGGEALSRVRSLSIDYPEQPSGMDIVLPDKFRHRAGPLSHILTASSFVQTRELAPEIRAEAQMRTTFNFAQATIKYLLEVPSVLRIRVAEQRPRYVESLGDVDVVLFEGDRGFRYELFLNRSTGMPVGASFTYPGQEGAMDLMTASFQDYRAVDGVRFPFRTEAQYRGRTVTSSLQRIRLNPAGLGDVFPR
jgi:hypothetical protein